MQLPNIIAEQCDRLHGKIYCFDDAVMIGSSNASANGLSFEGMDALGWDEANLVTMDRSAITSIFNWMAALSVRPIETSDLSEAKVLWRRRQQIVPPIRTGRTIEDLLGDGVSAFEGRGIYMIAYAGNMTQEGENAVAEKRRETGLPISAFEDWDNLPNDGVIICFRIGPRGGVTYEGCYERRPEWKDTRGSSGYSLQWCIEKKQMPLGLVRPSLDKGWKAMANLLIQHVGPVNHLSGQWINLEELAKVNYRRFVND